MSDAYITIPNGREILRILKDDIIHVMAEGSYSITHLANGKKHKCSKNLKTILEKLIGEDNFYQTHKSHVVNLKKITKYRPKGNCGVVMMICGTMIPISKREKSGFLRVYKK